DVDGDGDLDHLVSDPHVGWRRNDGTSFSAHITIDATITAGPVQFADLNGDGLKDLIAADLNGLSAKWYRNMGANAFAAQAAFNTGLSNAVQIHPYDLDGDGDIDLVINGIFNDIGVFLNAGNGSFGTVQGLNTWNFTSTMHVFDVDGDGDLDILNGNYTQFRWSPNDGLGQFGTVQPLQPNEPYSTQLKHSILADMDGDGLTDIVYSEDQETQLEWLPNRINTFFRITGRLFYDLDEDGIRDPEDPPVPWAHVEADPAPNFPFSSNNGSFLAYVDSGTFTVRPIIDTDLWYITSDSLQYTVTLNAQNPVSNGNDFGIFVDQEASDLHLALPNPVGLCADTVPHWIAVVNQGNLVESGILALDHDTLFTVLDAYPPPDSLVGNTYYWHYTDLGYYEQGSFHLTVVRPDAGHLGDSTHFTLRAIQFDPVVPGLILDTITVSRHGVVTCSYDPNDKQVDPVGYGASGALDLDTDHLDYTIRFQNTGNAPAVSVTLRDTLPPEADLDRLSLLAYSFLPTDLRVDSGNVLVIRLQNILLPDSASDPLGSQGFVSFRTGLVPGLPHGTEISNTAGIYFDLNPPIITNSTLNTLVDCALWQPEITPAGWDALTVTEGDRYHWTLNGEPVPDGDQPTITVTGNGIYAAQVTSPFGCIATATYEFLTTAVND
ncbi:MAG: VCBS repeat-containing protein, partial [Flavobacteriales bacterium]|nr:VCBS repeat-containing protein [Flavobacteriales bacterium]